VCDKVVAPPQRYRDLDGVICSCHSACLRPGLVEDDATNVIPRAILAVRAPVAAPGLEPDNLDNHGVDTRDLFPVKVFWDGDSVPESHCRDAPGHDVERHLNAVDEC
jgi:hypothetical protein